MSRGATPISVSEGQDSVQPGQFHDSLNRGRTLQKTKSVPVFPVALVVLDAEYTGRGPTKAHTVMNRDSVMILMADTLTKGERSLARMGMSDHVLETRKRYQTAMQDDLIGIVENHTGRKVIAFMSDNHIEPDMAAEVFVLEPLSEDGAGQSDTEL